MKPMVYVETTIPSFYFEVRPEPEMTARRNWTRDWWSNHRHRYTLATSDAVIAELEEGDYESRASALGLLDGIERLETPMELCEEDAT